MRSAPASPDSASVSTLANTMSGCCLLACSNVGANRLHGPHQPAQKSTRTIPSRVMAGSKVFLVSATVDMVFLLVWYPQGYPFQRSRLPGHSAGSDRPS